MPIEIRELVIRATVDPGGNDGEEACGAPTSGDKSKKPDKGDASPGGDLVQTCVREVMRVLAEKAER